MSEIRRYQAEWQADILRVDAISHQQQVTSNPCFSDPCRCASLCVVLDADDPASLIGNPAKSIPLGPPLAAAVSA